MRQYPIYNRVSGQGKRSSADFGSVDGFTQTVLVGTSSRNSHELATVTVERRALTDSDDIEFAIYVDNVMVKRGILNGSEFETEDIAGLHDV